MFFVVKKVHHVCKILSEFALEYRTTRERVIETIEKKKAAKEKKRLVTSPLFFSVVKISVPGGIRSHDQYATGVGVTTRPRHRGNDGDMMHLWKVFIYIFISSEHCRRKSVFFIYRDEKGVFNAKF
jgi:hypothetical protein